MASILALGILALKTGLKQKLSATFHYYIWFVLVIRLLIPYTLESPLSMFNLIPQHQQKIDLAYTTEQSTSDMQQSKININSDNETIKIEDENKDTAAITRKLMFNYKTAAWVWLIAAAGILLYIIVVNLLLLLKLKKLSRCEIQDIIEILEMCKLKLKVKSKVSIVYDVHLKSPMLCGVIHPKILISSEIMNRLSPEELKYIFLHELSHLKRKDLLVNIVCMFIQTVYWFNPVIHYSLYRMKHDCEIACDATALAALSSEENKKYGQTIINMLTMLSELHWVPGTLGFAGKFNTRRIIMITQIKKASVKWTAVAIVTLSFLAGCSTLAAPTSPISSSIGSGVSTQTSQDSKSSQKQNEVSTDTPAPLNSASSNPATSSTAQNQEDSQNASKSIIYFNAQYGFDFTLPASWKGYKIVTDTWKGLPPGKALTDNGIITGPLISIRHPLWTASNPRQDIPIMIFTLIQWNSLQKDEFHIGAAPIGPSELGRNSQYVFALPARYNFAFPTGYEEVENILKSKPINAADLKKDSETNSIEKYINLLGLNKEKLILKLNENPVSIDEGGLEFGKAGIRVWFKDYGSGMVVSQIFTQKKDIYFDGIGIGDKISSFKKALGNPISDKNGEAHFKYKDIFLSFNYDTKTENTICVYFLKEDY